MAWRCSGSSNTELVRNLHAAGIITSPAVMRAMQATDRAHYTRHTPYQDSPQSIPRPSNVTAQATISAPHVHALALEVLVPRLRAGKRRALDVGCGSGYLMACLSRLLLDVETGAGQDQEDRDEARVEGRGGGLVVGIDHMAYLTALTRANLASDFGTRPEYHDGESWENRFKVVTGDGREGCAAYAPYDAIHVGAAARTIPVMLEQQLACPGIMFVPVGEAGGDQWVYIVEKDEAGTVTRRKSHGVRYVPLTDAENQQDQER